MLKEFSVPAMVPAPTTGNLTDHIVQNAETNPSKVVFSLQRGDAWVGVTAAQFLDEVKAIAKGIAGSFRVPLGNVEIRWATLRAHHLSEYKTSQSLEKRKNKAASSS